MSQETTVLLRSILYQIMKAKSLDEAERAIRVMCSQEDIAVVREMLKEERG